MCMKILISRGGVLDGKTGITWEDVDAWCPVPTTRRALGVHRIARLKVLAAEIVERQAITSVVKLRFWNKPRLIFPNCNNFPKNDNISNCNFFAFIFHRNIDILAPGHVQVCWCTCWVMCRFFALDHVQGVMWAHTASSITSNNSI